MNSLEEAAVLLAVDLAVPTIHLNGTSKKALIEDLEKAVHALRAAVKAVAEASPNARDYYLQGHGAFPRATKEHASRLERVQSVEKELMTIWEAIEGIE